MYRVFQEAPSGALDDLKALKFSVALLGDLQPIEAGEIDHARYALVVKGIGPLDRQGFALPNSPHYDDELEQYHYARNVSASFSRLEPHELYRQSVERVVEPGATWPPYGAPLEGIEWFDRPEFAERLAAHVQQAFAQASGEPIQSIGALPLPEPIHGVGVSIYRDGLAGCAISWAGDLHIALRDAALAAYSDERHGARLRGCSIDQLTIVVSLLLRKRSLGPMTSRHLELFYRLGRDTLLASSLQSSGIVLAHFAVHQSLDRQAYQIQVLRKAGIAETDAQWTAFETYSCVVRSGSGERLEMGFPKRTPSGESDEERWRKLANEIARFVLNQRAADGLPAYMLDPWSGKSVATGSATRILIAITSLLEARGIIDDAAEGPAQAMLRLFVSGSGVLRPRIELSWDSGSDAQLLNGLCKLERRDDYRPVALKLIARLHRLIRDDGAIHAGIARMPADLDFLSGSVLLALARASDWIPQAMRGVNLRAVLAFYRRRFRLSHPWGMVWWHGQAWNSLADRDADFRSFAFELVDWAIERQSKSSGAFIIENLEPQRASFLTGCVLESVADAWSRAIETGDNKRSDRYADSWRSGVAFIERLQFRAADEFFFAQTQSPKGGIRQTLASSTLRVDYSGHSLIAVAKGLRALLRWEGGAA